MLYAGLAVAYVALVADFMALCYVMDNVGHDHHVDDHLYNRDGSLKTEEDTL